MAYAYDFRPGWIGHGSPRAGGWHLIDATKRWHLYDDLLPAVGAKLVRACDGTVVPLDKRPRLVHRDDVAPIRGAMVCEDCQAEWDRLAALPAVGDVPRCRDVDHQPGTVVGDRQVLPPVDPATLSKGHRRR